MRQRSTFLPEHREVLTVQTGSKIQAFYLGLACSHYGNRNYFCPDHQLSLWQWFSSSAVAGIRNLRPQPYSVCFRVRVHDCEICDVPRGMHSTLGVYAVPDLGSRQVWGLMLNHPAQSLFIGCFPMGAATLINGALVSTSIHLSKTCL